MPANALAAPLTRRRVLRLLAGSAALAPPFAGSARALYAQAVPIPSSAPSLGRLAAPPDFGWVATTTESPLWANLAGSLPLGIAPAWTVFQQIGPQTGPRLWVRDLYSGAQAYVDAVNVGPVDAPQELEAPGRWWGSVVVDGANLRASATTRAAVVGQLPAGSPVVISAWLAGEEVVPDNVTWAQLSDSAYLYSAVLRPVPLPGVPPPPTGFPFPPGRWIDLNLTQQVVVAYEGPTPVHAARTSTGRPGWETAPGLYTIQRRVENETMDSSTLLGQDTRRAHYRLDHVRWTQYFSADGKALHENYWKPRDEFGIPSSHGCAGLVAEDAQFFWNWATMGTPLYAHA